jgi:hypothetical protein
MTDEDRIARQQAGNSTAWQSGALPVAWAGGAQSRTGDRAHTKYRIKSVN